MDWKLDRQRRERKQTLEKKESAQSINIFGEMEREFTQIFGEGRKVGFSPGPDKSGNAVLGAARSSRPCKTPRVI
jgi:hypothetical protein